MQKMTIPDDWTAEDALLIYLFLSDLQESIASHCGAELMIAYKDYCRDIGIDNQETTHETTDQEPF